MIARASLVIAIVYLAACHPPLQKQPERPPLDPLESVLDEHFHGEHAMNTVQYLTQFWRIGGGPGYDACISYIESDVKQLASAAAPQNVRLEYRVLEDSLEGKTWVPEDAVLSMESPESFILQRYSDTPVMLCQNSFPHELSAQLTYVPGGDIDDQYNQVDVRGKLVLCDVSASSAYKLALSHGAVGVISDYIPAYNKPQEHPDIVAESGLPYDDTLKPFAINISPHTSRELKQRLLMQQVVLHVEVKASFVHKPLRTLIAEIPGAVRSEERVVLVAHIDHYKPGADDNASGSATLLEMLHSIMESIRAGAIPPPARTITFLWVDENRGVTKWSNRSEDQLKGVEAAFVLDMVGGDPEKVGGSFRVERMPDPSVVWMRAPDQHSGWGVGTWDKKDLFGSYLNDFYLSIVERRASQTGWKTATNVWEGGSDHDPFLHKKIPAILSWHYPDFGYHSSMDLATNLSPGEMKNAGVCIAWATCQLAAGTEATARSVAQIVDSAAKQRIETLRKLTTLELSDAQVEGTQSLNATKRAEWAVLEAWAQWYDEALESAEGIPVQPASPELHAEIQRQRDDLRKTMATIRVALGL